jgi:hypothetical protein
MNETMDLKNMERRAFSSFLQDGLWDIFIGFLLLGFGLRIYTDNVLFTLLIFLGVAIMIVGRRYITVPRLGVARFGMQRRRKQSFLIATIALAVIFSMLIWIISDLYLESVTTVMDITFSLLVVIVFAMVSFFLGSIRIFVYGLILASVMYLVGVVDEQMASILAIGIGTVVLAVGVGMLILFIRKYPVPKENSENAI